MKMRPSTFHHDFDKGDLSSSPQMLASQVAIFSTINDQLALLKKSATKNSLSENEFVTAWSD